MLNRPHLLRLLCVWTLLLMPQLASAHSHVHPETRVGDFEVAAKACVRLSVLANSSGHQENDDVSTAEAVGYPHATKGAGQLSKQAQRSVNSLTKRLNEHKDKLDAFRKNPDAFDNKGFLKNAPSAEVRERIIQGRIRHLEGEVKNFEKQISDLLGGGG